MDDFQECAACAAKPGSPTLCAACLHNRELVSKLRRENEVLMDVYAVAARLRTFPVPFDDHFELCGAVDACRPVIEHRGSMRKKYELSQPRTCMWRNDGMYP